MMDNDMKLKAISAIDLNNGIGKDGDLLYKVKADMKHFVACTGTDPIIMRRGTFESFGARPLPNRLNIVISRQENYDAKGAPVVSSLEEAFALVKDTETAWIIGGAGLYTESLPLLDEIEITQFFAEKEADTFFPEFTEDFECTEKSEIVPETDTDPAYQFQTWKRKSS